MVLVRDGDFSYILPPLWRQDTVFMSESTVKAFTLKNAINGSYFSFNNSLMQRKNALKSPLTDESYDVTTKITLSSADIQAIVKWD